MLTDIRLDGEEIISMEEISFSEESAQATSNLQLQTQVVNDVFYLRNSTVKKDKTYFIINGNMDKYKGNFK